VDGAMKRHLSTLARGSAVATCTPPPTATEQQSTRASCVEGSSSVKEYELRLRSVHAQPEFVEATQKIDSLKAAIEVVELGAACTDPTNKQAAHR